ncbi:MAG TPA: chemotaxis protein CheW, partial [Gemmatimonadaceae bacterium]|nr:chemotaxis protein CheW [Gemmatimonadaceae bacterium]
MTAPPAAAVAELLLFTVGGEWFGVPLAAAEEALEELPLEPLPGMPAGMLGVAPLRGQMLSVYATRPLLGVAPADGARVTLIVRGGGARVGLLIDDVEDVLVTDLAMLRPVPGAGGADPVLRGVTAQDGRLVA